MEIVDFESKNIMYREATVKLSMKEIVAIWAVFGNLSTERFHSDIDDNSNLIEDLEHSLENFASENYDLSSNIYEEFENLIREML